MLVPLLDWLAMIAIGLEDNNLASGER